jgi:hypothetical protein
MPPRLPGWLKMKVSETGEIVINGFVEPAGGRLDGIAVAEMTEPGGAGAAWPSEIRLRG